MFGPSNLILIVALAVAFARPALAADWMMTPDSTLSLKGTIYGSATGAKFKSFKGAIKFDPNNLAASSIVVIVDMTSLYSGISESDSQVKEESWFNAAKFPVARFASKSIRALGGDKYEAAADLTMRGVTHEVTLPFTVSIAGKHAHATGKLTLSRLDYGIGKDFPDDTYVGRMVEVDIDLGADQAP